MNILFFNVKMKAAECQDGAQRNPPSKFIPPTESYDFTTLLSVLLLERVLFLN